MTLEQHTLGQLLSDPRIRPIAGDAIRARDKAQALTLLRRDIHTLYTGDE